MHPRIFTIKELIEMINKGRIQSPRLIQRGFVWGRQRILALFESIIREYPIGILIFWEYPSGKRKELDEYFQPLIDIGKTRSGDFIGEYIVIDGYQRLTSIMLMYLNEAGVISRKGRYEKVNAKIYYNPIKNIYDLSKSRVDKPAFLIRDILSDKYAVILKQKITDDEKYNIALNNASIIREKFYNYPIPVFTLSRDRYELTDIIDVFNRVNSKGTKVQINQIILAYLAAHIKDVANEIFNLSINYARQGYRIKIRSIVKTLSYLTTGYPSVNKLVEGLEKENIDIDEVRKNWIYLRNAIDKTIDILKKELGESSLSFIPTDIPLIIPFTLLAIYNMKKKNPVIYTSNFTKALAYWVFLSSIYGYYISSTDTKLLEELNLLTDILNKNISSKDLELQGIIIKHLITRFKKVMGKRTLDITPEEFKSISDIKMRKKFILYVILTLNNAIDWYSAKKIGDLAPSELNLHHVFPRSLFKKRRLKEYVSSIGNLTFIEKDTNKYLGSKLPNKYFRELEKRVGRPELYKRLETHLIPIEPRLWNKSRFSEFIEERETKMVRLINNSIIRFLKEHFHID